VSESGGVVGIDHQQKYIDQPEAAEKDAKENHREAAPDLPRRHRGCRSWRHGCVHDSTVPDSISGPR